MSETLFFPLFVDLSKKKIVVVGAGNIALRRIQTLFDFAGQITVIAPEIRDEIRELKKKAGDSFCILPRAFEPADLEGADLVLAVSSDHAVNETVGKLCREKGIPVNVSHKKELSDFYFPGVVRKENVVIGVTASGTDHAQAKAVTDAIRNAFF